MPPAQCFFVDEELDRWMALFALGEDVGALNAPLPDRFEGSDLEYVYPEYPSRPIPVPVIDPETGEPLAGRSPVPDRSDVAGMRYQFTIHYADGSTRTLMMGAIMGPEGFATGDRLYLLDPHDEGEILDLLGNAPGC